MSKKPSISNAEAGLLAKAISSLHSNKFPNALVGWLECCLPYDNLTTLAYFHDSAPFLLMVESQHPLVHAYVYQDYLAGAYLFDPFHDLHLNKVQSGVYRLSDIAPDNFQRSRYFREYYSKTTLLDEIGFVMYPSPDISIHICLGKDANSRTKFTGQDMRIAKRISPIVMALATAHWTDLMADNKLVNTASFPNLVDAVEQKLGISLSPRQAEVAILILQGHSSTSIGIRLGISPQTVKVFRKQLYKKCAISSQAELFTLMLPMLGYDAHKVR